jgi:hypothetical protein
MELPWLAAIEPGHHDRERHMATASPILPRTAARVSEHTSDDVNRRIRHETIARVAYYAAHPELLEARLDELDQEWDIERVLEANASSLALTGTILGIFFDRRFLVLPALVTAFLLQHALQGWCPPVPLLRRIGVRTAGEIEAERYALKAVRGDFSGGPAETGGTALERAQHVVDAVRGYKDEKLH